MPAHQAVNQKSQTDWYINSVEKLMSIWTRERGKYAMDIFVHVNSIKLHSSNLLEGSGIQH